MTTTTIDPFAARALSLAIAVALDLLLGDPSNRWHPVAWLGRAIAVLDRELRGHVPLVGRFGGSLLATIIVLAAAGSAWGVSRLAGAVSPWMGVLVDGALIYATLSATSLARAGLHVAEPLVDGDLEQARSAVSRIVSRDMTDADSSDIARATVESLAENTVDGVIAPMFWAAVLGPAGAWLHKAASTLDSMVGYRTAVYERFGTASARLDDVLAWAPARLAIPFIALAAAVQGLDGAGALRVGRRDRSKHESPNSAHGEAVFAGALGIELGGPAVYGGAVRDRARIGEGETPTSDTIRRASRLVRTSSAVFAFAGIVSILLVGYAFRG